MNIPFKQTLISNGLRAYKKYHNRRFKPIFAKYKSYTMICEEVYCSNLRLVHNLVRGKPGDIVECGVWRGGMIAGIADLLNDERRYHLFDSFEGLPPVKEIDGKAAIEWQKNKDGKYYFDNCTAEINFADEAMKLTNSDYELNKGWFDETLPKFLPKKPLAMLRLDGDWYDSTMTCLKNLYPKVISGGLIIIDDYYTWDGCSRAVHDYLSSINSTSRISTTREGVAFMIKVD